MIEAGKCEPEDEQTMARIPRELLIGWTGITDDAGKDVPFSESALDQLLEIPAIAGQIIKAWFSSMEVAKKGN